LCRKSILLYNGFRWHIRAYGQEHHTYRDFVLVRFITSSELGEAALHADEQDHDWQSVETLIIAPHPDLTPDQQAVIVHD
jgi:predicted DNA-binding transcriptional regulator YafY